MKHLKKFNEGNLDMLGIIKDCFMDLQDEGYVISVSKLGGYERSYKIHIEKHKYTEQRWPEYIEEYFKSSDIIETLDVATSYLKDEYYLVVDEVDVRGLTDGRMRRFQMKYNSINKIKKRNMILHLFITLTDESF